MAQPQPPDRIIGSTTGGYDRSQLDEGPGSIVRETYLVGNQEFPE